MLDPHFDFKSAEAPLYEAWEASGAFQPKSRAEAPEAETYSIVIPPPNVTGVLHMGHALNNTLQDVLIRYNRMLGKRVLWQPGTDHAGIATQMVVERQLAESGSNESRASLGREEFEKRIWEWKNTSGGAIVGQLKRLGASCDWSRERFTLDEGLSAAVRKVFVQLYEEGLIYRDKRLVNWDPHFQTAISDLEVENKEVQGHFWHFKYPLENGETYEYVEKDEEGNITLRETRDYISIATTRPETMLGDGAVAVHPSDERYAPIVGKMVQLPLANRLIPIITDEHPDPDFGSGAVKITGAHDFNDYQVAKRHGLPMHIIMDETGKMKESEIMPAKYVGMDRFDARKHVVRDIDAQGLLERVEDKLVNQPFGDRSGVVIEPMLTDQWFVDAATLAKPALEAVHSGQTQFVPKNWEKTYFNWLDNIEPWCVSRQLWWGHRIPAWYDADGNIYVAETEDEAQAKAGAGVTLTQDEDVLDTWFSSGLWPFSTLGWPEETEELQDFYPTSTLVTAFDIIFFWVARMMMQGLHFMKDSEGVPQIPFKDVYIHALVLDEKGQKMSKSKGNVVDPLELMDEYGADALRFTMTSMAAQGRDIRLSKARVEGYRNFATKLWSAARYVEMNEATPERSKGFDPASTKLTLNKWILSELQTTTQAVTEGIEAYKFNEASAAIYRFIWNIFCDWYVEFTKPIFQGDDEAAIKETRAVMAHCLDSILKLLHPFMPFVTEALWQGLAASRDKQLIVTDWPKADDSLKNEKAADEINWMIDLISGIRSAKSDLNIPPGAKAPLFVIDADDSTKAKLSDNLNILERLARLESTTHTDKVPEGALQIVVAGVTYALPLAGLIDIEAERARLNKEMGKLEGELKKITGKLSNENFRSKAPEAVIAEQERRKLETEEQLAKLAEGLKLIEGV